MAAHRRRPSAVRRAKRFWSDIAPVVFSSLLLTLLAAAASAIVAAMSIALHGLGEYGAALETTGVGLLLIVYIVIEWGRQAWRAVQ